MSRRLWRVMRGLGRSVGDSLRRPSRDEQQARDEIEDALAEQQARAEIEGMRVPPPADIPDPITPRQSERLPDLAEPAGTRVPDVDLSLPPGQVPSDPALAPHYAALDLPAGASVEQIEHAYRRLKAQCDPSGLADDPLKQARARQQEARLDEAYLSLRQALVRERRL